MQTPPNSIGGDASKASAPPQKQQHAMQQRLPAAELAAYLACFAVALATAGYAFCTQVSVSSLEALDPTILTEGHFGYKMDNTYLDFNYFLSSFVQLLCVLTGHLLVSRLTLRFCSMQLHHLTCATVTLAVSCTLLSAKATAMFLCLHGAFLIISCAAAPLAVWTLALVAFLRFSGASFGTRELRTGLRLDARGAHLFYPICGYLYCRFLSMGLCLSARAKALPPSDGPCSRLLHLMRHLPASLHYAFYLPNFLGGPVVTLDNFLAQRRQLPAGRSEVRIREAVQRAGRLTLWLGVTMATVHCFHAGAYLETLGLRLARRREPIAFGHVAFAMYTRGQLFMLEYVQYYGWPALFAYLDGVRLPHWPACICRVASYREMWRLFDRGLFSIVREHVYIPLGGSRRGLVRQLGATAASFGFICLYHGNYDSVQAWILLNLALVGIELIAARVYNGGLEIAMLNWASPRCLRRLVGCLAAANLIPPSVGIFYFFYGTFAGKLIMREVLWKPLAGQSSLASFGVFCASFYCSVQLAIEYKLRGGDASRD